MRSRVTHLVLVAAVLLPASQAQAQAQATPPQWRPWRPLVTVGATWVGADGLGSPTASARAAAVGTSTPSSFTLFRTDSDLGGAPRADLGIGLAVTPAVAIELVGTTARPTLETRISSDVEGAANSSATEAVEEYTIGARVSYELRRWRWDGRTRPFVSAGGAYLRQLHQDRVLVETGQMWTTGVGLRLFLRGAGPRRTRPLGVTAELGWAWRRGGIAFVDGARSMPTAQVRLFAAL